ncbi:MAG: hypothetical protein WAM55_07700 [Methylovirgula sp.]
MAKSHQADLDIPSEAGAIMSKMVQMPPKPHEDMKLGKGKAKPKPAKKRRKKKKSASAA